MEKITLYNKEFSLSEIDYIAIKKEKGIIPKYSICISYDTQNIVVPETETTDELKIARVLQSVKEKFSGIGHFVSIYRSSPLINIYRAKNLELKKCAFNNRNYLEITLHNGSVFSTKPEDLNSGAGYNDWQYHYDYYKQMCKTQERHKER